MQRSLGLVIGLALFSLFLILDLIIPSDFHASNSDPTRYNLVLIVCDAMRYDVIGCYGGSAKTPNIDWLCENGARFDNAYSTSTRTAASSVSMFTANYPTTYPLRRIDYPDQEEPDHTYFEIPDEEHLIFEDIRESGYEIVCYLENNIPVYSNALRNYKSLASLTEREIARVESTLGISAYPLEKECYPVLRYILEKPGKPFLLLVWFLDPHAPYNPPAPMRDRIPAQPESLRYEPKYYTEMRASEIKSIQKDLTPYEIRYLKSLYLAEVESVDRRIGFIIEALRYSALLEKTFIIVTSDHGESFGEHGWYCHGGSIFSEVLTHVPLIIYGPTIPKGLRIEQRVSHVGLSPTIAELLGVKPKGRFQGKSFAHLARGGSLQSEPIYFVNDSPHNTGIIVGRWKLLLKQKKNRKQIVRLFDMTSEGGDYMNVADQHPDIVAKLKPMLLNFSKANKELLASRNASATEQSEERKKAMKREFKSLGYMQ